MATVTREIHIEAAPEVVREHVADPVRRRGWLDDDAADVTPTEDGGVTYTRRDQSGDSHVHIEVVPDGDGTRVRVTEEVPADVVDTPEASVIAITPYVERRAGAEVPRQDLEDDRPRLLVRAA